MASIMVDRLDGLSSSTAFKGPVRAATLATIPLSGEQTIDGIAIVEGDRVLVRSQSDTTQNGIYLASTGAWRRAKDFSLSRDVIKGTRVAVNEGTTQAGKVYAVASSNPVAVGTDAVTFSNVTVEGVQADDITEMIVLTQAAYDALSPPNATTLYVVVG